MRKIKRTVTALLASCMTLLMAMPAYAEIIDTKTYDDGTVYVKTDKVKTKDIAYPCWIWTDGYCYYYTAGNNYLKNTVTPDGCQVDAEGRWIENGVPQTNGYGSFKMGTEVYNGKSEEEIWNIMKDKLIDVYGNSYTITYDGPMTNADGTSGYHTVYAYKYDNDSIWFDLDSGTNYGGTNHVFFNDVRNGNLFTADIAANWSDQVNNVSLPSAKLGYSDAPFVAEKTIKTVIGDNVGQELFNYIRTHADKTTGGYFPAYDANGNVIHGWEETILDANGYPSGSIFHEDPTCLGLKTEYRDSGNGDGMNVDALDLSGWQNRMTDYGKRFSVTKDQGFVQIHVYH